MKVVVSAWIGSNNLGDELIFMALLKQLDEFGIARADVTAVTLDVAGTRETIGTNAAGHFDFDGQLRAMRAADVLLFGGGGLLQDETSVWNLPHHLSRRIFQPNLPDFCPPARVVAGFILSDIFHNVAMHMK